MSQFRLDGQAQRARRLALMRFRWLDMIVLGVISAGVTLVVLNVQSTQLEQFSTSLRAGLIGWIFILFALIGVALIPGNESIGPESWFTVRQEIFKSMINARGFRFYLPTWVAALVGVSILGWCFGLGIGLSPQLEININGAEICSGIGAMGVGFILASSCQSWAWTDYVPHSRGKNVSKYQHFLSMLFGKRRYLFIRHITLLISSIYLIFAFLSLEGSISFILWFLITGAIVGTIFPYWADPNKDDKKRTSSIEIKRYNQINLSTFHGFKKWINIDRPVINIENDSLNHAKIAKRITTRLRSKEFPNLIILGSMGSGKTTLGHFVRQVLESKRSRIELIQIELWLYKTSDAAVTGVLNCLIRQLAYWVDITPFHTLTNSYLDAINSAGGAWSSIQKLIQPSSDLETMLNDIDNIALLANRKFVLWIEDLERFSLAGTSTEDRLKNWEKIQPILALIYKLGQLQSVSVVVATTQSSFNEDINKIARYSEVLPTISHHIKANILSEFRKHCIERFPNLFEPNSLLKRDLDQLVEPNHLDFRSTLLGYEIAGAAENIVNLCDTPRQLKYGLRRCLEFWERFPGEIAFDHLLVINLVRADNQSIFLTLSETRKLFMTQSKRISSNNQEGDINANEYLIRLLTNNGVEESKAKSITAIARYLFSDTRENCGQSFSASTRRHEYYWNLIIDEPEQIEIKDQTILQILAEGRDNDLLTLIQSNLQDAIIDFRKIISQNRVEEIFTLLVDKLCHETPQIDWTSETDSEKTMRPPGFDTLWLMMQEKSMDGQFDHSNLLKIVKTSIIKSIKLNLTLAFELDYKFIVVGETHFAFLKEKERVEARHLLQYYFEKIYSGHPERLAKALRGQSPPVLVWLLWGLERVRQAGEEMKSGRPAYNGELPRCKNWKKFAETILQAISLDPKSNLIQLAWLLTRSIFDGNGVGYKVDKELAVRLFGSLSNVQRVLKDEDPESWLNLPVVLELLSLKDQLDFNN